MDLVALLGGGGGLLATLLSALFKGLFDGLFGYVDKRAEAHDHEELGATKVIAAVNERTADAQKRMAQVVVDQPDVDEFIDALERSGTF